MILQEQRNEPGPAGLMGSADALPSIPVKIFVEEDVIPEVRIIAVADRRAEYGAASAAIL